MRTDEHGAFALRGKILQEATHKPHPFGIKAVEGLVQKQHVRMPDERERQP